MEQALSIMDQNVKETDREVLLEEAYLIKDKIHKFREKLKKDNIENVRDGKYQHKSGLIYNDIVSKSEKAADHTIQVAETAREMKKGKKKDKRKDE